MTKNLERLKAIFGEALALDPNDRAALLDRECGSDAALRREVEELLAEFEQQGGAPNLAATLPLRVRRPAFNAGTVIAGKYTLLDLIGEGGMGTVWRARQTEPVQRDVAVKIIKSGTDTKSVLARFEAERQALALMDHPNIARVYDGGTYDSLPYFVMELVKGVPITDYCDGARLTPGVRLELFVAVCRAVQHAHQKGVIHRDLKPANVLVLDVDGRPTPKVIDFGVAKAIEQRLTDSSFGDTGMIVGTPQYMSPEQADSLKDIDTRTDIYALGVLLYELLAGAPPLEAKDFQRGAVLEMLRMVREVDPPKPSTKAGRAEALPNIAANRSQEPSQLLKLLRGDVDWIVMKALEKDRERRYESANSFAADVQRFLANEPVEARPPSAGYRLRKFVRRNRGGVVAASLVALALVAGVVVSLLALQEARQQQHAALAAKYQETQQRLIAEENEKVAVEARRNEEAQKTLAQASEKTALEERDMALAIRRFLRVDLLQQADARNRAEDYRAGSREYQANPRIKDLLDRAYAGLTPERIEAKFPNQKPLQGAILSTIGDTYLQVGEFGRAIEILGRVAKLGADVHGPEHELTLTARYNHGLALLYNSEYSRAAKEFEELLAIRQRLHEPDHHALLNVQNAVGAVWCDLKKLDAGIDLLERTRDALLRTAGPDDSTLLATMNNLATAYQTQKKYDQAIAIFKSIIETESRLRGPEHPQTLVTKSNLAAALHANGQRAEAIAMVEAIYATRLEVLGTDHRATIGSVNRLAKLYLEGKDWPKAVENYEKAYDGYTRIRGADDKDTLIVANNLAWTYQQAGKKAEAVALYEKVLEAQSRTLGRGHSNTLTTLANLGFALDDDAPSDRATALLKEAAQGSEKYHFKNFNAYKIVDIYIEHLNGLGNHAEAEAWRAKLVNFLKDEYGPETPQVSTELYKLSAILVLQNKYAEAERVYREMLSILEKKAPDVWDRFNVQSELGYALLRQQKYADAETLLLSGYKGMKERESTIPAKVRFRLTVALERLIGFYKATDKPDEVKKWQAQLPEKKE